MAVANGNNDLRRKEKFLDDPDSLEVPPVEQCPELGQREQPFILTDSVERLHCTLTSRGGTCCVVLGTAGAPGQ